MLAKRKCSAPCIYATGGHCTLMPIDLYFDEEHGQCWSYVRDPVKFVAMMMKRMLKEQEDMTESLKLLQLLGEENG